MQKARIARLAAAAVAVLALPLAAEDMSVTRVTVWKVKPGMEAKFEEGLKRHNAFHRKRGDSMPFTTFLIQSGPLTGSYLRVAGNRHWQDFDAEAAIAKADEADSAVNTDPYIESSRSMYFRFLPDVSRIKAGAPPAMFAINFYRLKFGKTDDFTRAITKFHEAIGKTQWPVHYGWFALVNGGEGPEFVLSLPRDKWADFNPPEKPFGKMLEEAFGRAEADSIRDTFQNAVAGLSTEIIEYLPDLSYIPAKK
jgi:hypothetical protein